MPLDQHVGMVVLLFTKRSRESLRIAIPLAAIVTLTLLFAGDNNIPLTVLAFSRKALTAITVGHVVLIGALSAGTLQGIRAYLVKNRPGALTGKGTA